MSDKNGFRKYKRAVDKTKNIVERITNFKEFSLPLAEEKLKEQSDRCMDCGIAFCHSGCPINNKIPDFNNAIANDNWEEAYEILSTTNNFPEFTGRLCPAPCESACVLGINRDPVSIKTIENHIIEYAFENKLVQAIAVKKSGKKVAIVGSGPAGLAAADQLAKAGHAVTVYERNDKIGGLLRYGIPDFKLEKNIIDRRLEVMRAAGVQFICSANIGIDISMAELLAENDAVLLTCGSTVPREMNIAGRALKGVHTAMDFLEQKNRIVAGEMVDEIVNIDVGGKKVVVIGGGDTGADCVGTSNRLNAKSVTQIELLEKPPVDRDPTTPWPLWPNQLRTSTSHEEGCARRWALNTKAFLGNATGQLTGLQVVELAWQQKSDSQGKSFQELSETQKVIPCDLAFLAIGFIHPAKAGPIDQLGLALDANGNVKADNYKTSQPRVYAAGDMRMGQSLIVWAIAEGRKAAAVVHRDLGVVRELGKLGKMGFGNMVELRSSGGSFYEL